MGTVVVSPWAVDAGRDLPKRVGGVPVWQAVCGGTLDDAAIRNLVISQPWTAGKSSSWRLSTTGEGLTRISATTSRIHPGDAAGASLSALMSLAWREGLTLLKTLVGLASVRGSILLNFTEPSNS